MKLFSLVILLSFALPAHADPIADVDALLARQSAENGSCNKFRKKWHGVVKGGLTRESASHVSAAQAADALKLLEKYPFRPQAQAKVWSFFVENETSLVALPDQKSVLERYAQIQPPCEIFSRSVHRELLLKDVDALKLGKKEKKSVARVSREYLKDSASDATLSGLGRKLQFLATYLGTIYDGANKDALKARAEALLKDFEAGKAQAESEAQQIAAAGKAESFAVKAPELHLWTRMSTALGQLLGELE